MQKFNSKLIVLDFNLTVVAYAVHKKQVVVGKYLLHTQSGVCNRVDALTNCPTNAHDINNTTSDSFIALVFHQQNCPKTHTLEKWLVKEMLLAS